MYVRVKRAKTTAFVHTNSDQTVGDLKASLARIFEAPDAIVTADNIRLYKDAAPLDDDAVKIGDAGIENNGVVGMAWRTPGGTGVAPSPWCGTHRFSLAGEWEPLDVQIPVIPSGDEPAAAATTKASS